MLGTAEGRAKDKSRPPFSAPRRFFHLASRLVKALFLLALAACGGRTELRGTGVAIDASADAPAADFVTCEDAGDCPASTEYCSVITQNNVTTHACAPLPANCHACKCASVPKPPLTACVCTSDGDQITVSCN